MSRPSIRLYHGTSVSAGKAICLAGFRRPDLPSICEAVANEYDVPLAALQSALDESLGAARADDIAIYFTTGFRRAAGYAGRACELEWMAREAVYVLRHGAQTRATREANAWIKAETAGRRLTAAVVLVDFPRTDLRAAFGNEFVERVDFFQHHEAELVVHVSESEMAMEVRWEAEIPLDWIAGLELPGSTP